MRLCILMAVFLLAAPAPSGAMIEKEEIVQSTLPVSLVQTLRRIVSGKVTLDFLNASGNNSVSTLGLDAEVELDLDPMLILTKTSVFTSQSDGRETAQESELSVRGSDQFQPWLMRFLEVSVERDPFSGLEARYGFLTGLTGVSFHIPRTDLAVDGGFKYLYEERKGTEDLQSPNLHIGARAKVKVLERLRVSDEVKFDLDLSDSRNIEIRNQVALEFQIKERVWLRLGYEVEFRNDPVETFGKVDHETLTGIKVEF